MVNFGEILQIFNKSRNRIRVLNSFMNYGKHQKPLQSSLEKNKTLQSQQYPPIERDAEPLLPDHILTDSNANTI